MRLCVLAALPLLAFLTPSAAVAAGELGLSSDGVSWAPNLPEPLFDPAFRWVPGDRETASFWVRNQSDGPAVLDVTMLGSAIDSLIRTGDLTVRVVAESGAAGSTSTTGRHTLVQSVPVAKGQSERIDVTVDFDRASTNVSEVKNLNLSFDVQLTEDIAAGNGGTDDSDDDSDDRDSDRDGGLPGTGGTWWWMLPLGAAVTTAGAALAGAARKGRSHA
jgi:hypothetical protein